MRTNSPAFGVERGALELVLVLVLPLPLALTLTLASGCGDDEGASTGASSSASTSQGTTAESSSGSTAVATTTTGAGPGAGPTAGSDGASTSTGDASATSGATGDATEATTDAPTTGGGGGFCDGEGPIEIPGDDDACVEDLGKQTFLFALCSCSDVSANNSIFTDAFDSEDMNPDQDPLTSGSIGVNGSYAVTASNNIGGSLFVEDWITSTNTLDVAQALQCGDELSAAGLSVVTGEGYVEQDIIAPNGNLTFEDTLHINPGKSYAGVNTPGGVAVEPVEVPTPCDCADTLPIDAIVAAFAGENDNATLPLADDALTGLNQPTALELPCGRYHLDAVDADTEVTIKILGRVVLVISGNIDVAGPFRIELAEGAELDLFIAGDASFSNSVDIGDPEVPAATRVYVDGAVNFSGAFNLAANLYMPNSGFNASNAVEVWGSLFVGGLTLAGPLQVHYDEAVLDLDGCKPPGESCDDCHDCLNPTPACVDGTCGPCQTHADCCPPLVCDFNSGECRPTIE